MAATLRGKKAGADPRTERRPPANFSKTRARAIAIIPNEKVTAEPRNKPIDGILYISRRARDATCSRDIADAHLAFSFICETRNLNRGRQGGGGGITTNACCRESPRIPASATRAVIYVKTELMWKLTRLMLRFSKRKGDSNIMNYLSRTKVVQLIESGK